MKITWIWFILSVVGAIELPEITSKFDIAVDACEGALEAVATVCKSSETGEEEEGMNWNCYCSTDAGFGSFTNCLVKGYHNNSDLIGTFISGCKEIKPMSVDLFWNEYNRTQGLLVSYETVLANASSGGSSFGSSSGRNHKRAHGGGHGHGGHGGSSSTQVVTYPVSINLTQFAIDKEYFFVKDMNKNYGMWFGYGILGFWCFALLIAAIVNWTIYLFPSLVNKFVGPLSNAWRKHISLSALYGKRKTHAVKHMFIIPSRMESILIFLFYFFACFASGYGIKPVPGNSQNPAIYPTVAKLVAVRVGIIVGFMCPLLVVFAGRNNFLQWVTRWNFATFITYHRWISRMAALLIIVHAICYITSYAASNGLGKLCEPFIVWGIAAGVCGLVILIQGLLFVRRKSYEFFLMFHILLALFFIIGGYKHTLRFGYGAFYIAALAVWALDRAIRISRLSVFGCPKATITLLAEETLRVVIPKPSYWHAIPGGHAFIHFLRPSCFWQSHPFTFTDSSEEGNYIVMYIKLKGGVTHGLYKHLNRYPGATAKVRVLVEGPYGEATSARKYTNAVFIAGGNGIPGIYSEVIDLSRRKPNAQLKLIWVLREWKSLSWFYQELKNLNSTNINTTVFITKPSITDGFHHLKGITGSDISINSSDSNSLVEVVKDQKEKKDSDKESDKESDKYSGKDSGKESGKESDTEKEFDGPETHLISAIKTELNHIDFQEGRPTVEELIQYELSNANGSTAFITCGHPVMVDDIRHAVAQNLHLSKHRVEFFEQLQVWN